MGMDQGTSTAARGIVKQEIPEGTGSGQVPQFRLVNVSMGGNPTPQGVLTEEVDLIGTTLESSMETQPSSNRERPESRTRKSTASTSTRGGGNEDGRIATTSGESLSARGPAFLDSSASTENTDSEDSDYQIPLTLRLKRKGSGGAWRTCVGRRSPISFGKRSAAAVKKNGVVRGRVQNSTRRGYTCNKCPTVCAGSELLATHERQHGKPGMKHNCPHCNYGSNRTDYIERHIQLHTGTNGASTRRRRDVRERAQRCSYRIEYPCHACPTVCDDSKALAIHVRQHGKLGMKHNCQHCDYASNRADYVQKHTKLHDGETTLGLGLSTAGQWSEETAAAAHGHGQSPIAGSTSRTPPTPSKLGWKHPELDASSLFLSPPWSQAEDEEVEIEVPEFFITRIKIRNVLGMETEAPLEGNEKVTLEVGKSTFIFAVMLGLGFDLCLELGPHSTICGLSMENAINRCEESASVELTLSLRAFPELQDEFGTQLMFTRILDRAGGNSTLSVSSADPRPEFRSVPPKHLGGTDLLDFLVKLKLSPERMILILLTQENVDHMLDHPALWYGLFETAAEEACEDKLKETQFLIERNQDVLVAYQTFLNSCQARLGKRLPVNTEATREAQKIDLTLYNSYAAEVEDLTHAQQELENKLNDFSAKRNDLTADLVRRMRTIFVNFLGKQGYSGELLVSTQTKELWICIWDTSRFPGAAQRTLKKVKGRWRDMSIGKKRIGVMGLYLALWDISTYLPVVLADACTSTVGDFQVPPDALSILDELLIRRCEQGKQSIITSPPHYSSQEEEM